MRMLWAAAVAALSIGGAAEAATFTISDMAANGQQAQTLGTDRASLSTGSTTSWAQTSVGVNKISSSANGAPTGDSYVSSIWGENFTVASSATGPVTVRFTVGLDGSVLGANTGVLFNYYLKAIRGAVDSLVTEAGSAIGQVFSDVMVSQDLGSTTRTVALDGDDTVTARPNSGPATPTYTSDYRENGGYFETYSNPSTKTHAYADHVERSQNGGPYTRVAGSNGSLYAGLAANFMVLDSAYLCPLANGDEGGCGNGVFGTPTSQTLLPLEFTLNPGDSFFVVGGLMVEGLTTGNIDFGATAKLTQVSAFLANDPSTPVALSSDSGTVVANGSSPFAASSAVPEPATWAMLIGGLGFVGMALRRRRPVPSLG